MVWNGARSAQLKHGNCCDSRRTVDITCRPRNIFHFFSYTFCWTFYLMFHSPVSHVVSLSAYIHPIVSSNDIFTLLFTQVSLTCFIYI
jgi:hypothetical protein